ncbi:MAG: hypothetical protein ACREV3_13160 [Gammaproteobacteria bacterium]
MANRVSPGGGLGRSYFHELTSLTDARVTKQQLAIRGHATVVRVQIDRCRSAGASAMAGR